LISYKEWLAARGLLEEYERYFAVNTDATGGLSGAPLERADFMEWDYK
jgi:hypothetical protein